MLEQAKDRWLRAVMYDRGLSPAARVLGAVLISDFLGNTRAPDIDAFAKALCVSPRTTKRALNQLEQAGWLTIANPCKRRKPLHLTFIDRPLPTLGPSRP
jgi:MarR-like DNA-binding transcriptional regulator SgrR of sgrS sRNA